MREMTVMGVKLPSEVTRAEADGMRAEIASLKEQLEMAQISADVWRTRYREMARIAREDSRVRQEAREAYLEKQSRERTAAKRPSRHTVLMGSAMLLIAWSVWLVKVF